MNLNKTTKAVLYARFSSDNQREESIEAQTRAMRQFAENHGIAIVGEYFDRAKSGKSADRAEFQKMIKDSTKGGFELVLVHKVDRFARNRGDSMMFRLQLKRNGVTVVSTSQFYDSESPEGMMMEAMLEAMAEYYSKNLASEVEKGKRENALKGRHVGGTPPLGYDLDRATMKLVINEHEATAVRLIFQTALDGGGYGDMIQKLRSRGFKTKRGHDFGKNSIFSILKNEKYTGTYIYSKSTAKDIDGRRNGHKYKDEDEIIRVAGAVPQIITPEDFKTVQEKMAKRCKSKARNRAKEVYLLSGKIVCGECGSAYVGHRRECRADHPKYISYVCTKKNKSVICPNGEIRREALEEHILDKLAALVFNDNLIPQIIDGYNEYQRQRNVGAVQEIQAMKVRDRELKFEIDNIVRAVSATGSLALAGRLRELETEQRSLDSHLCLAEGALGECTVNAADIAAAFNRARRLLKEKTLPNLRTLVDSFIDRVVLYKDHVEIAFNVGVNTDIFKTEKPHHAADQSLHNAVSSQPRDCTIGGEGGI